MPIDLASVRGLPDALGMLRGYALATLLKPSDERIILRVCGNHVSRKD